MIVSSASFGRRLSHAAGANPVPSVHGLLLLRNAALAILLCAATCVRGSETVDVEKKTVDRPNLVVFLTDDHSQLDSSPYGDQQLSTPNLQRLADAGMTFRRACVASPSCAPSRAALLTGLMPARNGAEANHSKPGAGIRKWPAYFQELGYEVVAFGKVSHYKHTADYGFNHFEHDGFHEHKAIPAAADYLQKRSTQKDPRPLCLMAGSNWPHVPWPEQPVDRFETLRLPAGSIDTPATRLWRGRYAAAVERADQDLGVILDAVQQYLPDNTLFLFSADHGAQWPFGKWNLYEAGIRVPLIVSCPGLIKPRSESAAMVSWVDILPTLLDAAGGQPPENIDGRSFLPILKGAAGTHREHLFATHSNDNRMNVYPSRSVSDARWKYIRNLHPEFAFTTHIDLVAGRLGQRSFFSTWEQQAVNDPVSAAVLQRYHQRPYEELYDLQSDPGEQQNLADVPEHAVKLGQLRTALETWMQSQGDRQQMAVPPRLLSDPKSYGPAAEIADPPATRP